MLMKSTQQDQPAVLTDLTHARGQAPARREAPPTPRYQISTAGPALDLITSMLGPGEAKHNEVVWRVASHGRPCLVYLHAWASGPQTVTTLDAARPSHSIVRNFEVRTIEDLARLGDEMRGLL